jgi:hypothetical protein
MKKRCNLLSKVFPGKSHHKRYEKLQRFAGGGSRTTTTERLHTRRRRRLVENDVEKRRSGDGSFFSVVDEKRKGKKRFGSERWRSRPEHDGRRARGAIGFGCGRREGRSV